MDPAPTDILKCPQCGGERISRSRRRHVLERLWYLFGVRPWRCQECDTRFLRRRRTPPLARDRRKPSGNWWRRLPASTRSQVFAYSTAVVLLMFFLVWLTRLDGE